MRIAPESFLGTEREVPLVRWTKEDTVLALQGRALQEANFCLRFYLTLNLLLHFLD